MILYAMSLVGICYLVGCMNQKEPVVEQKKPVVEQKKPVGEQALQECPVEVKQAVAVTTSFGRGVHHATDANFDHYLQAGKPVVIDMYATWCGPCKAMTPIITRLEQELGDKVLFVKVDVDQAKSIAQRYNVKAMPTFVFIDSKGNEVEIKEGSMSYDALKAKARKLL